MLYTRGRRWRRNTWPDGTAVWAPKGMYTIHHIYDRAYIIRCVRRRRKHPHLVCARIYLNMNKITEIITSSRGRGCARDWRCNGRGCGAASRAHGLRRTTAVVVHMRALWYIPWTAFATSERRPAFSGAAGGRTRRDDRPRRPRPLARA